MNSAAQYLNERQSILTRLLDAVKQCQVRFGGKTELATDSDSRVVCLLSVWESALQHGVKQNLVANKALSTLKQVTELTGLSKVKGLGVLSDLQNIETEPVFWYYVKEFLSQHEIKRYMSLKHINTDAGRGRAWLRSSFNEHSLERHMHVFLDSHQKLSQYYEDWAFLKDVERSSMLPMMAAGLGSILFAINIDNEELNKIRPVSSSLPVSTPQPLRSASQDEPKPVLAGDVEVGMEKKKDKKKKKKVSTIVSFDEDDDGASTTNTTESKPVKVSHLRSRSSDLSKQMKSVEFQTSGTLSSSYPDSHSISLTCASVEERTSVHFKKADSENIFTDEKESKKCRDSEGSDQEPSIYDSVVKKDTNRDVEKEVVGGRIKHSRSSTSLASHSSRGSAETDAVSMDIPSDLTPLSVLGEPVDVDNLGPYSKSLDSRSGSSSSADLTTLPNYPDTEHAALALAMAQKGLTDYFGQRTEGDGGNVAESPKHETMTTGELKQAVVAMMVRKDEVEEQNKALHAMYDSERETNVGLRLEIEEMEKDHKQKHEADQKKIQALGRENDLLKHQLKKYVSAVQLLRTQGAHADNLGIHLDEPQPVVPPEKEEIDYCHEASEYERKLVQVAEMHGELMEFNEMLHKELNSKEILIKRLQNALEELRGPLPSNSGFENVGSGDDISMVSTDSQNRPLVNIWIPSAFMRGKGSDIHHVYQIYIRIKDEEWNVYRRYAQFNELHKVLKKKMPILNAVEFPPKKAIGNKGSRFVEERRKKLQLYLRRVLNYIVQQNPDLANGACKDVLLKILPFFGDQVKSEKPSKKGLSRKKSLPTMNSTPLQEQSPQYSGL
ncbi:sorting nexin-29 [Lingula anatina]|uniref:Sorting nexin-29 n=1 Tax=Lingula anatina TaxID=7574 RepID=A0A1S3K5M4_LINAN|nr:sorting nexin-29 [Lingula anatina]|eukprot:XP_013417556.1 sorting nexin-29 [Lingula anatina]